MKQEIYSNIEDCINISVYLERILGNNLRIEGSMYQEVISGNYYSNNEDKYAYLFREGGVTFSYKYNKDYFFSLSITSKKTNSLGKRLATLSDFYEVLSDLFGEPTAFCITNKGTNKENLLLHWSFINEEEDIKAFKERTFYDDAKTDEVIIFGEQSNLIGLTPKTLQMISQEVGLPFELITLVDSDIEEFKKNKNHIKQKIEKNKNIPLKRVLTRK